jgi:hypothetical protein
MCLGERSSLRPDLTFRTEVAGKAATLRHVGLSDTAVSAACNRIAAVTRSSMRYVAAMAFSIPLLSVGPAWGVDWSVKGVLSEAVELSDNQFLRTMLAGGSLGSYSSVSTTAEAKTPNSKFNLTSEGTYRKYWGPGVDGLQSEYINYGFRAYYERSGKVLGDRTYAEASYGSQSAALAVFNALGLPNNASGFINQSTARVGWDRTLTSSDYVSVGVKTIYTDFDPSNVGIPFTDVIAAGTWKHKTNSTLTLVSGTEVEQLHFQNPLGTNVVIVRGLMGAEAELSPLLSVRGSMGGSFLQIQNGFASLPTPSVAPLSGSSSAVDWLANIRLTYKMTRTATLFLDGSRTLGPSVIGSILTQSTVRSGVNYDINYRNLLSLFVDFTRLQSPNVTDFVSANIGWAYELTRTWRAKVAYRYIHRFTTTGSAVLDPTTGSQIVSGLGPASSNSILFVLSKSFTVLPSGT